MLEYNTLMLVVWVWNRQKARNQKATRGDIFASLMNVNVTFLDATLNQNGVSMMQTIPVAVTKKVQRLKPPAPNCVMFIPKNEVTKLSGMKIKANLVSLATLIAVYVDFLASPNCALDNSSRLILS